MANRVAVGFVVLWIAGIASLYALARPSTARVAVGTVLCAPTKRCAPVERETLVRYTLPIFGNRTRINVTAIGDELQRQRTGEVNVVDLLPPNEETAAK